MSHAPLSVGPEGLEPSPARIKSPLCCHYTTTPCSVGRMRFKRTSATISMFLSFRQVVALRVELSATRLSAGFGQPALGYHVVLVGMVGLEPTLSCRPPRHGGLAAALHPVVSSQNGRTRTGDLLHPEQAR